MNMELAVAALVAGSREDVSLVRTAKCLLGDTGREGNNQSVTESGRL
jgi:hypothetical protein